MNGRLDELLAARADGALDDAGFAELESLLAGGEARRHAARWYAQERLLIDLHARRPARAWWRRRVFAAAAAASLLLAAGIGAWLAWSRPVLGIRDDGLRIHPGDELAGGGTLALPDGSRLALDAGCILAFPAEGPPLLRAGRLTAEVRPQPAGDRFAIATAQSLVEVVGTRFSLAVVGGASAVEVERGQVRVTDRAAGWVRDLLPGGSCTSGALAPPLVARDALWRIREHDESAPAGWTGADFDDRAWRCGRGPFGFGARAGAVATVIDPGPADHRRMTAYFRHAFALGSVPAGGRLHLRWRVDDGLVAHLNGVELLRDNMPDGPVAGGTAARVAVGEAAGRWHERSVAAALRSGLNILAVEVHQCGRRSSDLLFDLEADLPP